MTQTNSSSNTSHEFKILAIDGGGFKGLYAASLLRELERAYGPIADYFDLLCGTSTGALITLPLSIGKPAEDIVEFYKEWGPRIFPHHGRIGAARHWLRFAWHKSKHGDEQLKQAAKNILGSHQMGDAKTLLCVPAFNLTRSKPRVFKTDHSSTLNRDNKILMREVAMATAAAPIFFPVATCHEEEEPMYYIDGGIWANNPSLVGLTEACRFFVGPGKMYDSVRILSIQNVNPPAGRLASNRYSRSMLGFAMELSEAAMEGQQCSTDLFMQFLAPALRFPVEYVRIEAPRLSAKQSRSVQLDVANQEAIQTLFDHGRDKGHECKNKTEVQAFFRQPSSRLYRSNL